MDMDEINIQNHSEEDEEGEEFVRNGRGNLHETKINLDNERTKGLKGH